MIDSTNTAPVDAALAARILEANPNLPADRVDLFIRTCAKYGLEPDPDVEPREVLVVIGGGDSRYLEQPWIRLVTAGGLKLNEPIDRFTEPQLRQIFHAFKKVRDPRTGQEDVIDLPLPTDLRLPAQYRNGLVPEGRDRPRYGR